MALVQLELLKQIEKATGKKITDLFRWIVASGVGGLLMLVMVYGMRVAEHTPIFAANDPFHVYTFVYVHYRKTFPLISGSRELLNLH